MNDKNRTLYLAVKATASEHKNDVALTFMGAKIDYATMLADIDAVAGWFRGSGIGEGDAVTLCMPNIPQCVICFYALSAIGAVAHMVHPLAPEARLSEYMTEVKSKMLVIPDFSAPKYPGLVDEYPTLVCSPAHYLGFIRKSVYTLRTMSTLGAIKKQPTVTLYSEAVKSGSPKIAAFRDAEAPAVYLHSGGTGGHPKTIVLSSRAINALTDQSFGILGITEFHGGSMLAVLPMFHGFGLAMGIHAMLCYGGTDALMPKFHTADTIKLIEQNKVNYLIGVPVLYKALLAQEGFSGDKLKNLCVAFVGGDYVPKSLLKEFNERMEKYGSKARLYEGYGLTETVTVCSVNTDAAHRDGSVGKAVGGVKIAAFDGEKMLPPGEEGELCVSGDVLMTGYLDDEEATNAAFFEHDGDKFVRSGDVGSVDKDGFVFFRSRIKRIAKVNGVTVFPSEIEKLVMDEMPEVKEACAAAKTDARTGDSVVLFVTTTEQLDDEDKERLTEKLTEFIASRLSVYAAPKKVFYVSEFPKTLVGKVDVNKLKEIYLGGDKE